MKALALKIFVKFSRKKCFRLHFFINLVSGKHFLLRAVFSRNSRCKSPHFSNTFPVSRNVKTTNRMKSIPFLILSFFFIFSCNKSENLEEAKLIKSGYYPQFIQHFEILANLDEKYMLFYNPTFYSIPPPPPPSKNSTDEDLQRLKREHDKFYLENPKLETEYVDLDENEIKELQKIIKSYNENDFKEQSNRMPIIDGASTSTLIVLKNKKAYSIGSYEGANTEKEIELTSKLFSIYKQKCKSKINNNYIVKLEKR